MPASFLHFGATVLCSHGGMATPMMPNARVLVGGKTTAVQSTVYAVAGCPHNVSGSPVPCVTAQWTKAATRVFSNGQAVVLADSLSLSAPNGTPLQTIQVQKRVVGS